MITITVNDIRPVAFEMCNTLAGNWFITNDARPYVLAEEHELIAGLPQVDEKEMLQILEDNIRNSDSIDWDNVIEPEIT